MFVLESGEIPRSLWKCYKVKIESYMHLQMICLLGQLQNLNKVCVLKLFFFYDPANVGHPVNLSYNSIHEEFSRTRTIQASN